MLATPAGSGKSLVATAAHTAALARTALRGTSADVGLVVMDEFHDDGEPE